MRSLLLKLTYVCTWAPGRYAMLLAKCDQLNYKMSLELKKQSPPHQNCIIGEALDSMLKVKNEFLSVSWHFAGEGVSQLKLNRCLGMQQEHSTKHSVNQQQNGFNWKKSCLVLDLPSQSTWRKLSVLHKSTCCWKTQDDKHVNFMIEAIYTFQSSVTETL